MSFMAGSPRRIVKCRDYINSPGMYETIAEHFGEQGIQVISTEKGFSEYSINSSIKFNIIETPTLLHVILNGSKKETDDVMAALDDVVSRISSKTA